MTTAYANRGMGLETLIEHANAQYAAKGIALIQKVATPWKVIRKGKQIVSAFPERQSTVDFIGVANGKAIAFDAKETENKTRLPLANIEEHQLLFLRDFVNRGGKGFIIIEFKAHGTFWLMTYDEIVDYKQKTRRESIAYQHMPHIARRVQSQNGIVLDYLQAVGR